MRVLVCGSRHFTDEKLFCEAMKEYEDAFIEIIQGNARGADTLAYYWGLLYAVKVHTFPADWDKHGKAAGPIRNSQMLTEGKPDLVIAFLASNSRGTANMISQAEEAGVPVKVIHVE